MIEFRFLISNIQDVWLSLCPHLASPVDQACAGGVSAVVVVDLFIFIFIIFIFFIVLIIVVDRELLAIGNGGRRELVTLHLLLLNRRSIKNDNNNNNGNKKNGKGNESGTNEWMSGLHQLNRSFNQKMSLIQSLNI